MSLKFKAKEEISGITPQAREGRDISIAQTGVFDDEDLLKKPLGEIIDSGTSPRKIVEKVEKWCPMLNAQTVIGHKEISKIKKKPYFVPVLNILLEKKPERFTIRNLISWLNVTEFTKGDAQREVLASMVCMGRIKKIREKGKKKDKEIVKDFFCWNTEEKPCKFYKDDSCSLNWRDADETNFFTNQYGEDAEDESE